MARRAFVAGERLDMQQLAARLGVDRTTLFRWLGNRDQLVVNILISLTDPTLRDAAEAAEGVGGARIAMVARNYAQTLIETQFFQAFLRREAERALRLLTSKASPLQGYIVGCFERMLEQEHDRGHLSHRMALHDLAYLIVRIIESFLYADMITGDEPDAEKIHAAVAALLHA
ncbi:TetR/AcrR family transcriptional regulator [Amycolatopsis sp. RM579]|uniref:TetR/AcrR family transcriptional regulator n=2 Tax=Amycolatopsis pithecellobii TaxID=664692 RepID=A0A6N7Z6N8_9PSEU|nr:TetR/AcrR family transcriptional regulator [Amycolatopsis pithecellobii]